jgi:serine/threonine protein kinase
MSKITKGIGNPAYMSPELHEDQVYNFKADVWYVIFFYSYFLIVNIIIYIYMQFQK